MANQSDATFKFDTGPWKHTTVTGVELSNERVSIDTYTGLNSETVATDGTPFSGTGGLPNQSIFSPGYTNLPFLEHTGAVRQSVDHIDVTYQECLCDPHRQLSGFCHPERRRSL